MLAGKTKKQTGEWQNDIFFFFPRKQTSSCLDLMLNLQEGADDLEFLVSVSQSLLSFSSLDNF